MTIRGSFVSTTDLKELVRTVLCQSCAVTDSEAGSIYLVKSTAHGSLRELLHLHWRAEGQGSLEQAADVPLTLASLPGQVALTDQVLNLPTGAIDPGAKTTLLLPMHNPEGAVLGVLQLYQASPRGYAAQTVRTLTALADQAALLLERSQTQGQAQLVEQLLTVGTALSSSEDLTTLLNMILTKCRQITSSDAGSLYLIQRLPDAPGSLLFKVAQNDSYPHLSFRETSLPLSDRSLAGYVALTGKSLNLPDAYCLDPQAPYRFDQSFDQRLGYRTSSVLILPMVNQGGEIIGVVQLINRKQLAAAVVTPLNYAQVTQAYSAWEEQVIYSLASQAAILIERSQLQESIENLFAGFVEASVAVIEARDPCTAGHSGRVAELTVRLAQESQGLYLPSVGICQFSPQQLRELRYASLLHDFGKVGVPEAVLVKAKKLYPEQLELLRHRFALARQHLNLECAQARYRHLLEHPSHLEELHEPESCPHCQYNLTLEAQLREGLQALEEYWQLIEAANEPRVCQEAPLARLQEIAQITYPGLDNTPQPLVSNQELEQLLVRQGSLNSQERKLIESHVSQTYEFLIRIPWTRQLQDVPAIAYGHHEKLDGSGYPLALKAPQIPLQCQMMTIADIYDALTASDRPYKRALPVTRAMDILKQEAQDQKINFDLVTLFEQRQVFQVLGHALEPERRSR